jgi:TonB family protein
MSAIVVAFLLLQAAAVQRPPASSADLPGWSRTPSPEDMTKAYPPEALAANFAGSATIECTVGETGGLKDCVTVNEAAPGFGDAALAVASKFQIPTKSPSGASTAGRTVRVPIRWLNPTKAKLETAVVYDDQGRVGNVGFNCRVRDDRSLDNCVVVDARPAGTQLFQVAGEVALRAKAPSSVKAGTRALIVVEVRSNRQ